MSSSKRRGAVSHFRRVREPPAVTHRSSLLNKEPSIEPSGPQRSSRCLMVGPSRRAVEFGAYTECVFISAARSGAAHRKRVKCDAKAATAHLVSKGWCFKRSFTSASHTPPSLSFRRKKRVNSSSASRELEGKKETPSPFVFETLEIVFGARGVLASAVSVAAETPSAPRRTSTSTGEVCVRSVDKATRDASSANEPTRNVPAAASKNANPMIVVSSFFFSVGRAFSSPELSRELSSFSFARASASTSAVGSPSAMTSRCAAVASMLEAEA
mmetsp:Transcript_3298/g.13854  ORF Transcript_3298/g.13854 Transcript_3298/m.13854 type:complete len:271 (-) Transcript_3298:740-1552(-)